MPTVRKRGNSYQLVAILSTVNGHQERRHKTWQIPDGMTPRAAKKEAERLAEIFENDLEKGRLPLSKDVYFEDWLQHWYNASILARTTKENYKSYINAIMPFFKGRKMTSIKKSEITACINKLSEPKIERMYYTDKLTEYMEKKHLTNKAAAEKFGICKNTVQSIKNGVKVKESTAKKVAASIGVKVDDFFQEEQTVKQLSTKTLKSYSTLISSIFGLAVEDDIIIKNPAYKVRVPETKGKNIEGFCLQPEDVIRLMEALKQEDVQFRNAVMFTLKTGVRRGELFGLKWSDIDYQNRVIHIGNRTIVRGGTKVNFIKECGKTASATRDFEMTDELFAYLKSQEWYQVEQRNLLGTFRNEEDWVFTSIDGTFYKPNTLTIQFKKFIRKNDLPDIHLHSLRHTFATLYYSETKDKVAVKELLGHSSTAAFDLVYGHAIEKKKVQALNDLDKQFPSYADLFTDNKKKA